MTKSASSTKTSNRKIFEFRTVRTNFFFNKEKQKSSSSSSSSEISVIKVRKIMTENTINALQISSEVRKWAKFQSISRQEFRRRRNQDDFDQTVQELLIQSIQRKYQEEMFVSFLFPDS